MLGKSQSAPSSNIAYVVLFQDGNNAALEELVHEQADFAWENEQILAACQGKLHFVMHWPIVSNLTLVEIGLCQVSSWNQTSCFAGLKAPIRLR
jgi:hypothetical protein